MLRIPLQRCMHIKSTRFKYSTKRIQQFDSIYSFRHLSTAQPTDSRSTDSQDKVSKSSFVSFPLQEDKDTKTDKVLATKKINKATEFRRLVGLYAPEKKQLSIALATLGISTSITMTVPYGMGKIVDLVSAGGVDQLPFVTACLGSLFAVGAIANVIRVNTMNMIGERITNRLREHTYASILKQELAFFDNSRTGELINRLSSDTTLIGKVLSDKVADGLRSSAQAVVSVTLLFVTCPKLTAIMLGIVPPVALGAVAYGRYVRKLTNQVQKKLSEATEVADEKLGNMRVVRWFAKEDLESHLYNDKIQEVLELARKRSLASATFFGGVDISTKLSMLAVLGYGGQMVADGLLTGGELTSFLIYTIYVGFSFGTMSSFYSELMSGLGASQRIFELLSREPKILALNKSTVLPNINDIKGEITFENVQFAYPTRTDMPIFKDFNLHIRPNETLALVGASGCGKSTTTALLARFYELNQDGCGGSIKLDGIDIATLHPNALRSMIGAVSQEPPLFACSIRENIAYGCANSQVPSMETITHAAKLANAHDFIMSFPEKYDTIVGERGQTLSGGQKQRVAIARALIKQPKILILDEATSALDQESEKLIQSAIDKAKQGRTVILIAHRLSTIKTADRIAVIADGKVAEEGTYRELAGRENSLFSEIIRHGNQ